MLANVHLQLPDGQVQVVGHGAIIGRLWSAAIQINDGRVSEAHAMVSLRGRDLRLLALRGRFRVGGNTLADVALRAGQTIGLAKGVELVVVRVEVPGQLLALSAPGVAAQVLSGVTSVFGGRTPRLVAGWRSDAGSHVWHTGVSWMRSTASGPRPLAPDDAWLVGGVEYRAGLQANITDQATVQDSAYRGAVKILNRHDSVHFIRQGEPVVVVNGRGARLISELALAGCPVSWESLVVELWGREHGLRRDVIRRRWDMLLFRLRQRLRERGLRPDLVSADGSGLVQLVLGPLDQLVDDT